MVSVVLLEQGQDLPGVQGPPVQEEGRVGGHRVLGAPPDLLGFGVKREAPRLHLPQEMDHLGIASVPEMGEQMQRC